MTSGTEDQKLVFYLQGSGAAKSPAEAPPERRSPLRALLGSPALAPVVVAVIGLLGTAFAAASTARANRALEREKFAWSIITKALETPDRAEAKRRIVFLVRSGLLPDLADSIRQAVSDTSFVPSYPAGAANLVSAPAAAAPSPLVDALASASADDRVAAGEQLLRMARGDTMIAAQLVQMANTRWADDNAVFNAVAILSELDESALRPHRAEIRELLVRVRAQKGRRTVERAEQLERKIAPR